MGFTACPRAMMAAKGLERGGPRAAIMARGQAVKPTSPRVGFMREFGILGELFLSKGLLGSLFFAREK
jgi:hypothetical protein